MTRIRLLASLATVGVVALWVGTAFGGTVTTPSTSPFMVPVNAAGTGPAPFKVVAAGYMPGANVFLIICDGVPPTAQGWDPSINCDNGTSPISRPVPADGTATWDPAVTHNQAIRVFDGESPSSQFNCYYPGEKAVGNGEIDPANGLLSWTNCQIRVASTNGAVTADQAFRTMTLPVTGPQGTTTTTAPATTTTTVGATTTTTRSGTTTTVSATTTTTSGGATTTTTGDPATTTTSATVARSTTTSSRTSGLTTTTAHKATVLALTGLSPGALILLVMGVCLVAIGLIVKSRGRT